MLTGRVAVAPSIQLPDPVQPPGLCGLEVVSGYL